MLEGKVAVVTGASRGIGREVALTLAGYGAKVIVNYCGSREKAEEVVASIKENGGEAKVYQGDVSDFDTAKEMMASVKKEFGSIDILVNNAGITKDNLAMKMSEEEFDQVINVNLKGTFNCMKHVARIMLRQKSGHIINMSSVSGVIGNARADELLCLQGRSHRYDQIFGKRTWVQRDHGQCGGTGVHRYGDDGSASGGREEGYYRYDPVKKSRDDKGYRRDSSIFSI